MKDALKGWEAQDVYRRIDITHLVNDVISRKKAEIVEEEFESIDDVVAGKEVGIYKPKLDAWDIAVVLGKGTFNLTKNSILGILPGFMQTYIAKKLGDDPTAYTRNSVVAEGIAASAVAYHYISSFPEAKGYISAAIVLAISGISGIVRYLDAPPKKTYSRPSGSLYIAIPMYAAFTAFVLPAIILGEGIHAGIKLLTGMTAKKLIPSSYTSAWEERKKITTANNLRIEDQNVINVQAEQEMAEEEIETEEESEAQKRMERLLK